MPIDNPAWISAVPDDQPSDAPSPDPAPPPPPWASFTPEAEPTAKRRRRFWRLPRVPRLRRKGHPRRTLADRRHAMAERGRAAVVRGRPGAIRAVEKAGRAASWLLGR